MIVEDRQTVSQIAVELLQAPCELTYFLGIDDSLWHGGNLLLETSVEKTTVAVAALSITWMV
jgi:hypothetical protein